MRVLLIKNKGRLENIDKIPNSVKKVFKTVWTTSQKVVINMARDRQSYIDQSQSMSIYLKDPSKKLLSMHFYRWEQGLKTGMCYLRTTPANPAVQFSIDKEAMTQAESKAPEDCTEDVCISSSA